MTVEEIIAMAEAIVSGVLKAAPIIEEGFADAKPYVSAIVALVTNKEATSDEAFAAVNEHLDAGSAVLDAAAKEVDDEA